MSPIYCITLNKYHMSTYFTKQYNKIELAHTIGLSFYTASSLEALASSDTNSLLLDLILGAFVDLMLGAFVDLMLGAFVDFMLGALVDLMLGALVDLILGAFVEWDS